MAVRDDIVRAANEYGVDPAFALAVAERESNFNPYAHASKTIHGIFQMSGPLRNKYGVGDSNDPYEQSVGFMRHINDMRTDMGRRIGRDPTNAELYAGHYWGPSRAAQMASGAIHPDTPTSAVFTPTEMGGNPEFARAGTMGSLSQRIYGDINRRMGKYGGEQQSGPADFSHLAMTEAPDFSAFGTAPPPEDFSSFAVAQPESKPEAGNVQLDVTGDAEPSDVQASSISDFLGRIFSGDDQPKASPPPKVAPPPSDYPSTEDAADARKYGVGYGRGTEGYVQGDVARVRGETVPLPDNRTKLPAKPRPTFVPTSAEGHDLSEVTDVGEKTSKNLDLKKNPETAGIMGDVFARAALAANRAPIAALGFDPGRMVADTQLTNANVGGAFRKDNDSIYFNLTRPEVPVHESMHRGLEMLRQNPEYKKILDRLPDEEYLVRYLMATQVGDPERTTGKAGLKQRETAMRLFGNGQYDKEIATLTRAAQDMIAARRPRGPI